MSSASKYSIKNQNDKKVNEASLAHPLGQKSCLEGKGPTEGSPGDGWQLGAHREEKWID